MQRITISIDEALAETFDDLLRARAYQSRSEGVRDVLRDVIERWRDDGRSDGTCVANLSYVYNRATRALAQRLADMQHAHHDLVINSNTVRLDHEHSLESVLLKGASSKVRAFADQVLAERGVRFGSINLIGVDLADFHEHEGDHRHDGHAHLHPHRG